MVEPSEMEDTEGEKPEVVMAEEVRTGLEKPGIVEADGIQRLWFCGCQMTLSCFEKL